MTSVPRTLAPMADSDLTHIRVPIELGNRSYNILIGSGLLAQASAWTGLPKAATAVIVTNATVAPSMPRDCDRLSQRSIRPCASSSCPMEKRTRIGRRWTQS